MSLEDRFAMLEKKLYRTRQILVVLLVGLLLIGTMAAANAPFADLVCRSLLVKNPDGKTTVELKEGGDVEVGGTLKVKGADLMAQIEELRHRVKHQGDTLGKTDGSLKALENRLPPLEAKVTKITEGWFLIRSPMAGRVQTYILDVRGGRPDGDPVLQLAGDNNAKPQENRKFRLQLLD